MEQNIEIFSGENLPGGQMFEFCRVDNIQAQLVVVGGLLTQEVLLKPGTTIYTAEFLPETLSYRCRSKEKNNDSFFEHILSFKVFKRSGELNHSFETMENERYLVFFTNQNGMREVMGDKGHGAKFSWDSVDGRANEYNCKFIYTSKNALPVFKPTVTDNTDEVDDADVGVTLKPFG